WVVALGVLALAVMASERARTVVGELGKQMGLSVLAVARKARNEVVDRRALVAKAGVVVLGLVAIFAIIGQARKRSAETYDQAARNIDKNVTSKIDGGGGSDEEMRSELAREQDKS